jgi:hypothetical protein
LTIPRGRGIIRRVSRNVVPEPVARREIEKEADNHIALGRLLRKVRPEKKKNAVQKILASELSVPQKIERIREVDGMEEEQEVTQVVQEAAAQGARRRVARLIQTVKEPQKALPYFSYLFQQYGKIREFGAQSRVLTARIWPPGVRADPELRDFLVEQVQAAALALSPRLALVAEHGWLHLTPAQYNQVMLLRRLVQRLLAFDFVHLNFRDRNVIEKLRRIEGLFLMIHYRPETLGSIVSSLRTVYQKQRGGEKELDEATGLAIRLLNADSPLPCLANCLLGLNILRCRRLLTLQDLIRKGLGDMVSSRDFDCDPPVRKRIDDYVEAAVDSIRKLHDQIAEARRLNAFISRDGDGNLDIAELRAFYNTGDGKEKYDFTPDQDNMILFAFRLLRRFDRTFSSLLNGHVILEGPEKVAVFSRSFFQLEFSRLRTVTEKLEKGPFTFNRFPLSRYLQMKEAQLGAVGNEMEARQLIDEGVASLVDLGKTVSRILSLKRPAPPGNKTKVEPLEQVVLQGKPFSLPHEQRKLTTQSLLNGRTVAEALSEAVSVCFSTGLLMQDQFLFLFLGRERKSQAELESRIQMVENLLDPESFREIQALAL